MEKFKPPKPQVRKRICPETIQYRPSHEVRVLLNGILERNDLSAKDLVEAMVRFALDNMEKEK